MCIDAPWPLSTASTRISGNLSDTKASLLELFQLGPGALPLLQPMPCTLFNDNLPVRLQIPHQVHLQTVLPQRSIKVYAFTYPAKPLMTKSFVMWLPSGGVEK